MRRLLSRIGSNERGSVAILFALAMIPVLGAAAVALDYSKATLDRTEVQKAVDATALALAKIMPADQATLNRRGEEFFFANVGKTSLRDLRLRIEPGDGVVTVSATGSYQPAMIQVLGLSEFDVGARAEVRWGFKKLELALALDNTGSMASRGKMDELKEAVRALLETLQDAAEVSGEVKVSIVPFDTMVRLDADYDSPPSWIKFDSRQEEREWRGCIEDRDQPYDVQDTAPGRRSSTRYPAEDCGSGGLVDLLPLTDDWNRMRRTVDRMTPNGNTNLTIGLVWAWHALTPTGVLTEAEPPDEDLVKAIIILTDGENTENRWTTSRWSIDRRTETVCENIKADDIQIYAVRVIEGNAALLRNCASEPHMYYDVQDASQLSGVFRAIGANLANLHLAR